MRINEHSKRFLRQGINRIETSFHSFSPARSIGNNEIEDFVKCFEIKHYYQTNILFCHLFQKQIKNIIICYVTIN